MTTGSPCAWRRAASPISAISLIRRSRTKRCRESVSSVSSWSDVLPGCARLGVLRYLEQLRYVLRIVDGDVGGGLL